MRTGDANDERAGDLLLDVLKELRTGITDTKVLGQIAEAERKFKCAKRIVNAPAEQSLDMPQDVLDGRLGELCEKHLGRYPRGYSWISLLTAASVLVPRQCESQRFNVYGATVGPVGSGKSQSERAAQKLLNIGPPELLDSMVGSGEGLMSRIADASGSPRLYAPDELGHLFTKMQIQNSSFPFILTKAFYHDQFEIVLAKGKCVRFHASLSMCGGIVDEKFGDFFGSASTLGLYDRFLFGACPSNFILSYEPFESPGVDIAPARITIDPDVWIEKEVWTRQDPTITPRLAELAIRVASICASFDRRGRLSAHDLSPALALAKHQASIRTVFRPNLGENLGGKVADKILGYLRSRGGQFVSKRDMQRALNSNRSDPRVAESVYASLKATGQIAEQKVGKRILVRLILEDEEQSISQEG